MPSRLLALVMSLALSHTLTAQDTFTPQHIAKLKIVTSAVIAPDGKQIAYILSVPRAIPKEKDGPSWAELHVVDTKGNSTPYITGPVNVDHIAWTPDGKHIAFLAKRDKDETKSLYFIGTRGGEARKVLSHATDIQSFSFSGDGNRVAFLATEPVAKAKKARQDQGFNQEIYEEEQPFVRVWIADLIPTHERANDGTSIPASPWRLTTMLKLDGSASELHWNPQEDKLAVALAPSAGIDDHIMFRKVHIFELASGEQERPLVGKVTNLKNPGKLGQLAWSPDGKKLAMITGRDKHDPKEGRPWIHDGSKWIDVHKGDAEHLESFAWRNSDYLLFLGAAGVSPLVGIAGAKANGYQVGENRPIATDISVSRDGKAIAMIGHAANHPPEVYISSEWRGEPRRLTDSNPWLRTLRFARQEVIKYKARDGLDLEGILVRPLDEKPGQRYPLVLTVHGGPEAHYSNGWVTLYHSLGQVAAAKGMAVFYPNYRGSTGYGVEFSMKGQREAGGKEFDDLIDGVDHLVKTGLVDPKKVGITGGSYGGYATAWGSTYYSDRFAAGVMFVGISDWISCSGTTDIPQEMNLVHHRKWLWEDWDYFAKASPIRYLDKAKTPLLIMHGKNDPRVHPSQSLELYRHLKVRNQAPVRLVLYPGEGHGNRRAASRLDYNLRLLQWMEHYLKGPGGKAPPLEIDYGLEKASPSAGWRDRPQRLADRLLAEDRSGHVPWLGRACPCCIGW
ncbi:MAG: S9 family peptidase [Planctomycetes bacterium]|nr:S9 family peptidase [Planctomycetota bacterium]